MSDDSGTVRQIPLGQVRWPDQERRHFDPAALEDLARTLRADGQLQPIGVYPDGDGRFVGLYGERRWRAAALAGLGSILAVVREPPAGEPDAAALRMLENACRQDLRPVELASGLNRLMKTGGLTAAQAAARVGMRPAAVTKALALLDLPEPLQRQVDDGTISATAGYQLSLVKDPRDQAELAGEVASGRIGRDALAGRVRSARRAVAPSAGPPDVRADPKRAQVTAKLAGGRQVTVRAGGLTTVDALIAPLEELLGRCRSARARGLTLGTLLVLLSDEAERPGTLNPGTHREAQP
jgi:ParB family chromosome partitioning protein